MSHSTPPDPQSRAATRVATVLAVLLALLPAVGVPSEWVLQDTLKSALLAAGTLAAAWVWLGVRPQALRWHGVLAIPLLWMAYALGSMVWSHSYLAGVEAARWALLSLLLWLGLQSLQPGNTMRLVWGIHAGAVAASAWAAAQFWGDLQWFNQAAPPAATFVNRNFFAEYAVSALPFSVLALAQLKTPRWRQLMALSLGFNLVALFMTGTRSALGALMLMGPLVLYVLWRYRQQLAWGQWSLASRLSVVLVFGLSVLSLGSLPSGHPETLGQTALQRSSQRTASMAEGTVYKEGSFAYRSMMWRGSARMLVDKPWTGVGAGAWEVFIPLYQGPSADEEPDYYAHNEYLQLLAEYGLPLGGGTLAILLAYLLLAARNTWRLPADTEPEAPLRAVALCSLLALLVVSLAGFPWRLATTGALFMLNLTLLAGSDARLQLRNALGHGLVFLQVAARRTLWLALVTGSALAAALTLQALRAEVHIVRGIQSLNTALLTRDSGGTSSQAAHERGVQLLKEGIGINPHYRKVVSIASEQLASLRDWDNSAMVLHSIAASRPYIANVWANLVLAHVELQQPEAAWAAWQQLARLQPDTPRVRALDLLILSRSGRETEAIDKITRYFDKGVVEYDMTLLAYQLGLRLKNWDLLERALTLRATTWPELKTDSYFRLGKAFAEAGEGFEAKTLAYFEAGLQTLEPQQQSNYLAQIPARYAARLRAPK